MHCLFTLAKKQPPQKQRNLQKRDGMWVYYRAKSWHFIERDIICITQCDRQIGA